VEDTKVKETLEREGEEVAMKFWRVHFGRVEVVYEDESLTSCEIWVGRAVVMARGVVRRKSGMYILVVIQFDLDVDENKASGRSCSSFNSTRFMYARGTGQDASP
jgi:hypothetical protein